MQERFFMMGVYQDRLCTVKLPYSMLNIPDHRKQLSPDSIFTDAVLFG